MEAASPTSASGPSCTSTSPGATDTPASQNPDTPGLLFRKSCGLTESNVNECPYLCGKGPFKECSQEDFTGTGPEGFPPAFCQHCLPPCGPTCTSVAPGAKDTPKVPAPSNPSVFLRDTCGTTNETVADCPYLCGDAVGNGRMFCSDRDGSVGGSRRFGCTKCLPICSQQLGTYKWDLKLHGVDF